MLEIERKFVINNEKIKKLIENKEKDFIAQWYSNSERIRMIVNKNKIKWIKEIKKIQCTPEKRSEKKIPIEENEVIKKLCNFPVVIKIRYYLDDERKVSIDKYLYPKCENILEIELNEKEVEKYLKITKTKEKDELFIRKIEILDLKWEELLKKEKTYDENYFNFNIAKVLKNPNIINTGEREGKFFFEKLTAIYNNCQP